MFFLYILSPLFIITYLYNKFYSNIKQKLTFDDKKNNNFILLTIDQYSDEFKEIHSIIYNKKCSCDNKLEINNLQSLNFNNESNIIYNVVNYVCNNKTYKTLIKKNSFKFPIVDEIKNYVYLNKIKSAEIIFDSKTINITDILLEYIGPNYDFNYNTDYKQNIIEILKIENIIENKSNNYKIKLVDNFDNEIYIKETLVWSPNII